MFGTLGRSALEECGFELPGSDPSRALFKGHICGSKHRELLQHEIYSKTGTIQKETLSWLGGRAPTRYSLET